MATTEGSDDSVGSDAAVEGGDVQWTVLPSVAAAPDWLLALSMAAC
jgi:hypothetical protein